MRVSRDSIWKGLYRDRGINLWESGGGILNVPSEGRSGGYHIFGLVERGRHRVEGWTIPRLKSLLESGGQ